MFKKPKIICFQKIGSSSEGFLSICHAQENIDFDIKRVFWSYTTPSDVSRGRHAHHETEMVLIALKGTIKVETKTIDGELAVYELSDPNQGLFLPKLCWHKMFYSEDALQLVICSSDYSESDYIRSREKFESMVKEQKNG